MTPQGIIAEAATDGVTLALTPAGTVKVVGDRAAVERWLPATREHKPELVAQLLDAGIDTADGGEASSDADTESRRLRVLVMLADRTGVKYAVMTDTDANPDAVIVALAIRGAMPDGSTVTAELAIPRVKYDPFLLLELIERHSARMH